MQIGYVVTELKSFDHSGLGVEFEPHKLQILHAAVKW